MLAPQLGLAASEPVRRCGSVRTAKGRVLRRRLFRRVTVVDFAAAIAAAEERGGVVSRRHGHASDHHREDCRTGIL